MHCLKYSFKFKGLSNLFIFICVHKCYHSYSLYRLPCECAVRTCPAMVKSFALMKDESALFIYELLIYDHPSRVRILARDFPTVRSEGRKIAL